MSDSIKDDTTRDTSEIEMMRGFDTNGIHVYTGTQYNERGFDMHGIHKDTGTKYDPRNFDIYGNHKYTCTWYDEWGFDAWGFDKTGLHMENKKWHNEKGLSRDWIPHRA